MPKSTKRKKPQQLDDKTHAILLSFLRDLKELPNEAAKRTRFAVLIGELFPGSKAVTKFPEGTERIVRIDTALGQKSGRMDSYYGNAVIEFEKSLKATGKEAESQLQEYTAGLWSSEPMPPRPLIAIASDGVTWRVYLPRLSDKGKGKIKPEDIELELTRELLVTEDTLADFWLWLTSLLFRPGAVEASSEQFRLDFGATSAAFVYGMQALRKAWRLVRKQSEPRVAFEAWQKYLTVTYGQLADSGHGGEAEISELEELFLKHTYLASVARFLVWASLSKGKTEKALRVVADEIHSGEYFESRNIANLVEEDFFQWVRRQEAEEFLASTWERMLDQILTYDLSRLNQDVLKGVYQDLVDPKDRHDLGEYYTPDWLCERIVSKLFPNAGWVSVLDPACGSGSFLRAAIIQLLRTNQSDTDGERLRGVLDHVVGIDIHPLAVTISRTTYVLALGPLVKLAKRPIQIPVYLADSLFLPTEVKQHRLGERPEFEIRFGGQTVRMPEHFVESPELFDGAIAACSKVAVDHARTGKETLGSLSAFLNRELEGLAKQKDSDKIIAALWQFVESLAKLMRAKRNSIWAFIVRNSYRPAMLRGHFDLIVGNPPWLSYRYIADSDYQTEVKERAVERYAIAPKSQKLFTQMELATVFLVHSLTWFGKRGSQIGFVMPRSILSADQHANLRTRKYNAPLKLREYWDLKDVHELFRVPSCVLFGENQSHPGNSSEILPTQEWKGELPRKDLPWDEADAFLTYTKKLSRVIYLGERTAFSTSKGRTVPNLPSPYASKFRDGATIYPRNFYFVKVNGLERKPDPSRLYSVETDPEQAEDSKPPYDDVRLTGQAEGTFIYCSPLSKHVLPFTMLKPPPVVLPILQQDGVIQLIDSESLRKQGSREFANWMKQVEAIWIERRTDRSGDISVYQWLDYQGKLTNQQLTDRHLVLYNAAGTNLSATYVDRETVDLPFVIDHKLYYCSCASAEEGHYLASILNSSAVNEAIKPFQSMGLIGERDIHKKVLDLPFPLFDRKNPIHLKLAEFGKKAQERAAAFVREGSLPASLARRRALIRVQAKAELGRIDDIMKDLI
jgi:hypothetical protein